MDNKIVKVKPLIIIQARIGSTRLPGKVLKKVNGIPLIGYQIERLKQSGLKVVVATPDNGKNIELLKYVKSLGIDTFEGDEYNVLKRFYDAAVHFKAKDIIRITGDNPLVDGCLIKAQINLFNTNSSRYYFSEGENKRLPLGTSFELFSFDILKEAYENARSEEEYEHVTQYMVQNIPGDIDCCTIDTNFDCHNIRLTVDTDEDFELFELLIKKFKAHQLSINKIVSLFEKNDYLNNINNEIVQIQVRNLTNER